MSAGRQGGWEPQIDLLKHHRQLMDQRISQLLPSPQAELLSGILLGQNQNLPPALKIALRDTATLHTVVASGQNLSLVAGFLLSLAPLIGRKQAIILSLLAVFVYTLLAGLQVPIIRASLMFSLAALAQFSGRQKSGFWVLTFTAGLMLLVNPKWITSLSFQLSFLATFGVVVVAPVFLKFLDKLPVIGQDLAVTLAAQAMVIPAVAQNFHQISLVSLMTNVLTLWTVPFIMILGILSLILPFLSLAVNALLTYFIYVVQFFAVLPFAWEYVGEQIWIVWVGYYLLLASIMLSLTYAKTENFRRS